MGLYSLKRRLRETLSATNLETSFRMSLSASAWKRLSKQAKRCIVADVRWLSSTGLRENSFHAERDQSATSPQHVLQPGATLNHSGFKQNKPRTTFRSRLQKSTHVKQKARPSTPRTISATQEEMTTSCWVQIADTPPLAILEDVLSSVNKVMEIERSIGIIDLDAPRKQDGSLSTIDVDTSSSWVKKAKTFLSTRGRPTIWRIQFENRSIAHAFLQHSKQNPFKCVWKPAEISEWKPPDETEAESSATHVDDSMIRVENCPENMKPEYLRHIFRRYDFFEGGPCIIPWNSAPEAASDKLKNYNMFILRFADASWARAAIREMQGVRIEGKELLMAQYPSQLL